MPFESFKAFLSKPVVSKPEVQEIGTPARYIPKTYWGVKQVIFALILESVLVSGIYLLTAWSLDTMNVPLTMVFILIGQFIAMYGVWMGVQIYSSYHHGQKSLALDFGLRFKWYDVFIGAAIGGVLYYSQYIIRTVAGTLDPSLAIVAPHAIYANSYQPDYPAWFTFLFSVILPIFLAPFFEEMFFRGFVMGALIKFFERFRVHPELEKLVKYRFLLAALLSSIVFGFAHLQGYQQNNDWLIPIQIGFVGFGLAWTSIIFKRLGPGIIAHMTHNTIIALTTTSALGFILFR
jgi:membrane protease YdiL (CAAX protease family)